MNKAIGGDGWAFRPADGDKPAIWAGKESIANLSAHASDKQKNLTANVVGCGGVIAAPFLGLIVFVVFGLMFMSMAVGAVLGILSAVGFAIFCLKSAKAERDVPQWFGSEWQLAASGDGLAYSGGDSWAVGFDEINRIESGATVEWQRARQYPVYNKLTGDDGTKPIPDAEIQVFIFCDDGRRLVVHTANAAREDCGRLAHSIRSYVDAQKGGASPAPATSSPAADGFDL